MKFLEDTYDKELNSPDSELTVIDTEDGSYVFRIDGNNFYPNDILSNDKDLYNQAFLDWKRRKLDEYFDRAEKILELHDNRDRFNALKEIYRRNSVIPFIGAGMSNDSGYLLWSDFLYYMQENTDIPREVIEEYLNKGQFEEAAQILYENMGAPAFNELLGNTYGADREIVGAINFMPYIFRTAVITTNYDPILKYIYDNANNSFEEYVNGSDAESFAASLGSGKRTLLKLHGDYWLVKNRVLTFDEYQNAYSNEAVINSLIETAFFNKTLLFLGCSLNTDRTLKKMEEYVSNRGHERCVKHYCFLELPKDGSRIPIRNRLSNCNIFPIWYPHGKHRESIEALLVYLKGEL